MSYKKVLLALVSSMAIFPSVVFTNDPTKNP